MTVTLERADGIATVTLNRPEARNALSSDMLRRLASSMAECGDDDGTGVVILTGADPAFCAGLDLRELGSTGGNVSAVPGTKGGFWRPLAKPVIAAVNGPAVTGGLEIVLQCDFVVGSERARFADTHVRVGAMPGGGMSVLLPQAIGARRAREMSLTGNFFSAEEAHAWGLVNHVVAHDDLLPTARALAADMLSGDADTRRKILELSRRTTLTTVGEGLDIEGAAFRAWRKDGYDPSAVEQRRAAVVERGRDQQR